MIDIDKILDHLDKQIRKYKDKLQSAPCGTHINSLMNTLEFYERLREALTIKDENEDN